MENTEIMNAEVVEATEEIVKTGMSKGVKIAAGMGLAVVVGVVAYKYVAKPLIAKIKANHEQKKTVAEEETTFDLDSEDISEI